MISFTGYAPDLPVETSGIFTDCEQIIPMTDGFVSHPSSLDIGIDALSGAARGYAVIKKLDNTKRVFASTQTKIYELSGTTWTDRSDTGDYDLGTDLENRTRFVQFGNATIAAVGTADNIQLSTTGAFAAIAGSPKAKIIETCNNFVFAFNYIDAVHGLGTAENGWWCSALGDESDWSPSASTQCVAGTFIETPGPIIGARRLGSYIIAYKERSAYLGQYVGVPTVWSWQQLPGEVGALSHECIVNVGTAHYLISSDDFQAFDGSRFVSIGSPVRNTFFNDLNPKYRSRVCAAHDRANALIYWYYPSKSSQGNLDSCIVYNYKTDKWGRADEEIDIPGEYVETGVTYAGLGTLYSTYDDLPTDISYDSSYWTADNAVVSTFKTDHKIYTYAGVSGDSSITTGHYGDVTRFSTLTKIRPRFLLTPTSSSLIYSYSNTNADEMTQNLSTTLNGNVYDLIWSARWHKVKMTFSGNMKITGFTPEFVGNGNE